MGLDATLAKEASAPPRQSGLPCRCAGSPYENGPPGDLGLIADRQAPTRMIRP